MHFEKQKVIQVAQYLIFYVNLLQSDHFKRKLEGMWDINLMLDHTYNVDWITSDFYVSTIATILIILCEENDF